MQDSLKDGIIETKKLKIKYDLLKKEGYKLNYGEKTKDFIDIFFVKELEDGIRFTLHISEKRATKRIFTSSNNSDNIEALTLKEVQGIAQIISQIC